MIEKIINLKYKKAILVSYGAMFVEGALNTIIVSLMVIFASRFNKSNGEIAILVSLKSFGTLLVLFYSGKISDKYGRKWPIMLGSILFAVFIIGFIISKDYKLAMILSFVAGLAHGFMDTPAISILFDALKGNTGPAMSMVQMFFSFGGVLTTFIASIIIKNNYDFRYLFILMLIFNAFLFFLIISAGYPTISQGGTKEKLLVFKKKPKFKIEGIILLICTLCAASYTAIMYTWIPTYLNQVKQFEVASSVSTLSLYQIGAVSGALIFAMILRKVHTTTLMVINPLIAMVLLINLYLFNNYLIIKILILLLGFFMGLFFSLCINMGGELFSENAGAITGAVASSSMLGGTLVVWASGKLIDVIGINKIFSFSFILVILLIIFGNLFRYRYYQLKPSRRIKNG